MNRLLNVFIFILKNQAAREFLVELIQHAQDDTLSPTKKRSLTRKLWKTL
jgi:hypothetical protein